MPCRPIRVDGARNALTDFRIYTAATRAVLLADLANGQFVAEGRCTEGNRGRMLGNLTLSGTGTVFVAVRAGTWREGRPATSEAQCIANPLECVLAERSLTYAQHQSLAVPVTMDAACADTARCADGKTCIQGQCVGIPLYTADSLAPAPPAEQPALEVRDADVSSVDASDARASESGAASPYDAGVDAGPVVLRPRWYAVCRNGVASLEERPQSDAGFSVAPTCPTSGEMISGRQSGSGYDACLGNPKIDTRLYRVCCSVAISQRCCMAPSAAGGAGIPLLATGEPPLRSICSIGGESGPPNSPCFTPGECASGTCVMLKSADGVDLGYGQCM